MCPLNRPCAELRRMESNLDRVLCTCCQCALMGPPCCVVVACTKVPLIGACLLLVFYPTCRTGLSATVVSASAASPGRHPKGVRAAQSDSRGSCGPSFPDPHHYRRGHPGWSIVVRTVPGAGDHWVGQPVGAYVALPIASPRRPHGASPRTARTSDQVTRSGSSRLPSSGHARSCSLLSTTIFFALMVSPLPCL